MLSYQEQPRTLIDIENKDATSHRLFPFLIEVCSPNNEPILVVHLAVFVPAGDNFCTNDAFDKLLRSQIV